MMKNEFYYSDSDDVDEQVIQKISPDSSSHYEPECPCGCHLLADCSEKSFAIVPFQQNGSVINMLKLPIFKIKRQPKKTLFGYAKCRMVPFGRKGSGHHFPLPMWSIQQSDMAACLGCKEGQWERQNDMKLRSERQYDMPVRSDMSSQTDPVVIRERLRERQRDMQVRSERQYDMPVRSDMSSQTDPVVIRERPSIRKSTSQLQTPEPSTSKRQSPVKDTLAEEPEEEVGRYSYEDYRTGFGQWYPFFINKPSKRWKRD